MVDQRNTRMNHFWNRFLRHTCPRSVCVCVYYYDCASPPLIYSRILWPWTQIRPNAAWVISHLLQHTGHLLEVYPPFNSVTEAALQSLLQPPGERLHIFCYTSTAFDNLCETSVQTSTGPWALKFVSKVHQRQLVYIHGCHTSFSYLHSISYI